MFVHIYMGISQKSASIFQQKTWKNEKHFLRNNSLVSIVDQILKNVKIKKNFLLKFEGVEIWTIFCEMLIYIFHMYVLIHPNIGTRSQRRSEVYRHRTTLNIYILCDSLLRKIDGAHFGRCILLSRIHIRTRIHDRCRFYYGLLKIVLNWETTWSFAQVICIHNHKGVV